MITESERKNVFRKLLFVSFVLQIDNKANEIINKSFIDALSLRFFLNLKKLFSTRNL